MYFVLLDLQKVIKHRYILVNNFTVFRDPHLYRFFLAFWKSRGLQKWSFGANGAVSKKKGAEKGVQHVAPGEEF